MSKPAINEKSNEETKETLAKGANGNGDVTTDAVTEHSSQLMSSTSPAPGVSTAAPGASAKEAQSPSSATPETEPPKPEKKKFWTWERTIEIMKLVVTIWAALLGSYVTMEFNQRQNELNRIQSIAQMLPHMGGATTNSSGGASPTGGTALGGGAKNAAKFPSLQAKDDDISREGAFWAIFRTAKDRVMLRDLAALFPLDIYRVISSIAVSGELEHDEDAIVALEVASEKLAQQYSEDPQRAELAARLYSQSLNLRNRAPNDPARLRIIDLTDTTLKSNPSDDQQAALLKSINDLADAHLDNPIDRKPKTGTTRLTSKDLYQRARQLGSQSSDQQVLQQVARADLSLSAVYLKEQLADDAYKYLKEEFALESKITGKPNSYSKNLDKDGDGYASIGEIQNSLNLAQARLRQIFIDYPDKGAALD